MAKAPKELQEKAKSLGIKSWHTKGAEKLEKEIKEIEDGGGESLDESSVTETVSIESVEEEILVAEESVTPAKEPAKKDKFQSLVDVMQGSTWDQALMKIKMMGKKSKFWPYREQIESKVNGN